MRLEIQNFLQERQDLLLFIRENPFWYRLLSRNPTHIHAIEQEAKKFYGKTVPQKMERLQQKIQVANMLMSMMFAMNNNN